jgi:hypothetical protein
LMPGKNGRQQVRLSLGLWTKMRLNEGCEVSLIGRNSFVFLFIGRIEKNLTNPTGQTRKVDV